MSGTPAHVALGRIREREAAMGECSAQAARLRRELQDMRNELAKGSTGVRIPDSLLETPSFGPSSALCIKIRAKERQILATLRHADPAQIEERVPTNDRGLALDHGDGV